VYAFTPREDAITELLREQVESWTDVRGLDDLSLARRIREDEVHVLVDLAGHTVPNRIAVLAMKPAPVQVSWLGYPEGTGLRNIDARLSDRWIDPPDEDALPGRDRVLRLGSAHAFRPLKPLPPVSPLPALANGFVTLGCVQQWSKLNPATVKRWASLLRSIPDSRLVVGATPLEGGDWVSQLLEDEGVPRRRVQLLSRESLDSFYSELSRIDFLLDSWPYAGTTTTCLALAMGVPTLTLAGDRACSRTCASVLAAAGLEDWIACDPAEFHRKALARAQDFEALSDLRGRLREQLGQSRLGDGRAMARELEDQFESLVGRWIQEAP
jgi:predicted O-linked N-acetylglucosamine transferase (SPINDLY family)